MKDNVVYKKSYKFSLEMVEEYKYLIEERKEFILSKQMLRSGTSIGANVKEGITAQSKMDFLSKMNIALKEASETEYWIELLRDSGYVDETRAALLFEKCDELIKILSSIVKTTKLRIEN